MASANGFLEHRDGASCSSYIGIHLQRSSYFGQQKTSRWEGNNNSSVKRRGPEIGNLRADLALRDRLLSLRRFDYFLSLQTLRTLYHREFHLLAFLKGTISIGLDGGVMYKHIAALGPFNEPVAFGIVEPLHSTCLSTTHLLRDPFQIIKNLSYMFLKFEEASKPKPALT